MDGLVFGRGEFEGGFVGGFVCAITQACAAFSAHAQPIILTCFDFDGIRHFEISMKIKSIIVAKDDPEGYSGLPL